MLIIKTYRRLFVDNNPETVIDKSTVDSPAQFSEGIEYVIVMGVVVKDKNGIVEKVSPGIPIKRGK